MTLRPIRPTLALALALSFSAARATEPAAVPSASATPAAFAEAPAAASPATVERAPEAVLPFVVPRSNEAMEFQVSYLGVPMGKVRLFAGKVDGNIAPIFMQAQTTSIFAVVTLRQQLASFLDVETGLPRSGSLDAVEGSYRHNDTVKYDRATNKATVREKGKFDNTYVIDVPPDAMDFVALVYRLRSMPLENGAKHEFRVLAGRVVNTIVAEVLGREKIETKSGEFQAVKVRVPTGFTGKFSEKNPTFVWFSDDDRRVVVRITADFAIGHATANLASYTPGTAPPPPSSTVEAANVPSGVVTPASAHQ